MRLLGQFILYRDILHRKKAYKALKQRLLRYFYTPKNIIKHTGDFHPDNTPRSIKKQATFVRICLYTWGRIKIVGFDVNK